jgi:hypothetical protein
MEKDTLKEFYIELMKALFIFYDAEHAIQRFNEILNMLNKLENK